MKQQNDYSNTTICQTQPDYKFCNLKKERLTNAVATGLTRRRVSETAKAKVKEGKKAKEKEVYRKR